MILFTFTYTYIFSSSSICKASYISCLQFLKLLSYVTLFIFKKEAKGSVLLAFNMQEFPLIINHLHGAFLFYMSQLLQSFYLLFLLLYFLTLALPKFYLFISCWMSLKLHIFKRSASKTYYISPPVSLSQYLLLDPLHLIDWYPNHDCLTL